MQPHLAVWRREGKYLNLPLELKRNFLIRPDLFTFVYTCLVTLLLSFTFVFICLWFVCICLHLSTLVNTLLVTRQCFKNRSLKYFFLHLTFFMILFHFTTLSRKQKHTVSILWSFFTGKKFLIVCYLGFLSRDRTSGLSWKSLKSSSKRTVRGENSLKEFFKSLSE